MKKSLINLSIETDYLNVLKAQSKDRGFEKLSDYICDWLKKLSLERSDIKRIILQVPEPALKSREALEAWLFRRLQAVLDHFFKRTGDVEPESGQ